MDAPERAKPSLFTRLSRYALVSCMLLVLLLLLGAVVGYIYIPSPEWMALSQKAALIAGAVVAALSLWAVATSPSFDGYAFGDAKNALGIAVTPFAGFALGYAVITFGVPMVGALVAGHPVERVYTVASTDRVRMCWNAIELIEAPFPADKLCGYSSELRDSLWPRDRLAISGRGWKWGLIATDIRKID